MPPRLRMSKRFFQALERTASPTAMERCRSLADAQDRTEEADPEGQVLDPVIGADAHTGLSKHQIQKGEEDHGAQAGDR